VTICGRRALRLAHPCQRFHPAPNFDANAGLLVTEVELQELVDRGGRIVARIQERLKPWVALIDQFFDALFVLLEFLTVRVSRSYWHNLADVRTKPPPLEYRPTIQPNAPAL
jgi:hypothetical protein